MVSSSCRPFKVDSAAPFRTVKEAFDENMRISGDWFCTVINIDYKLKRTFGWKPRWHIEEAVDRVCEWSRVWFEGGDIPGIMDRQINDYING